MVRMCSFRVISATARIIGIGPDGQHQVNARAVVDQLAQLVGDQALVAVAAVVGGDKHRIADLAHFALQDDEIFVASADNRDHAIAGALQRRGRGIGHRRSHASAHHHHGAEVLDLRRFSQRPHDVQNAVAGFSEFSRLVVLPIDCTTMLIVPFSGSECSMVSGMRSPCLVEPQDYELPRPLLVCNAGRLDDEPLDSRGDELSVQILNKESSVESEVIVTWRCDNGDVTRVTGECSRRAGGAEMLACSGGWGLPRGAKCRGRRGRPMHCPAHGSRRSDPRCGSPDAHAGRAEAVAGGPANRIKQCARDAGFDLCGIAPVRDFAELRIFPAWIADGQHGEMKYMEARDEAGRTQASDPGECRSLGAQRDRVRHQLQHRASLFNSSDPSKSNGRAGFRATPGAARITTTPCCAA